MMQYSNGDDAIADVESMAGEEDRQLLGTPANLNSPFVSVFPHAPFEGANEMATISINLDPSVSHANTVIHRASPGSSYVFTPLDTQIVDGRAVAQTDQGGIFVAGSGVNFSLVVGVVVAAVVLLLVAIIVVGTIVYFVARPEKWVSAKTNMKKTQMKMKRSFARQV